MSPVPPTVGVEDTAIEGPADDVEEVLVFSPKAIVVIHAHPIVIVGAEVWIARVGCIVARVADEAKRFLKSTVQRTDPGEKTAQVDEGFCGYLVPSIFSWSRCEFRMYDGGIEQR